MVIEELLEGRRANGRHALDEDALHTPIFAALSRGGWRRRQQEGAAAATASAVSAVPSVPSVEDFRRDPLTAPIPIVPAAAVTGGVLVDMAAGEGRRRARAARERSSAPRDWTAAPREWAAASRDWAGLDALADTGRHHLRVAANW